MKVSLFDASYMLYYATYPDKEMEEDGVTSKVGEDGKAILLPLTWERVMEKTDSLINAALSMTEAEAYIGFLEYGKCFRHTINENYKSNRKDLIPPIFLKACKQYLIDRWKFQVIEGIEADDAVNIARNYFSVDHECTIISPDKDVLALPGKHFNPRINEFVTTTEVDAYYKRWLQIITGDSTDGVKGIPGIGPKKAEKLFTESDFSKPLIVLEAYIEQFGERDGIKEFYKNYMSLWILDKPEFIEFTVPKLQLIEKADVIINNF